LPSSQLGQRGKNGESRKQKVEKKYNGLKSWPVTQLNRQKSARGSERVITENEQERNPGEEYVGVLCSRWAVSLALPVSKLSTGLT
jgi:hypothetical protein